MSIDHNTKMVFSLFLFDYLRRSDRPAAPPFPDYWWFYTTFVGILRINKSLLPTPQINFCGTGYVFADTLVLIKSHTLQVFAVNLLVEQGMHYTIYLLTEPETGLRKTPVTLLPSCRVLWLIQHGLSKTRCQSQSPKNYWIKLCSHLLCIVDYYYYYFGIL